MDIREFLPSPMQNQTSGSCVDLATPTFSQASTGTLAAYYSSFPFLEYNVQKDSVFCFSCRHFPSPNADTAFIKVGVKNRKKIKEKLQQHAKCRSHIESQRSWIEFQATSSAGSVATQLSKNQWWKSCSPLDLCKTNDLHSSLLRKTRTFPSRTQ